MIVCSDQQVYHRQMSTFPEVHARNVVIVSAVDRLVDGSGECSSGLAHQVCETVAEDSSLDKEVESQSGMEGTEVCRCLVAFHQVRQIFEDHNFEMEVDHIRHKAVTVVDHTAELIEPWKLPIKIRSRGVL